MRCGIDVIAYEFSDFDCTKDKNDKCKKCININFIINYKLSLVFLELINL